MKNKFTHLKLKKMKKLILLIVTSTVLFAATVVSHDNTKSDHGDKYCAKMKDGKKVVMHEGMVITAEVTLTNGSRIQADGTLIKKDGTKKMLKEGECVDKAGKLSELPVKEKNK
jgi:hypothetical protein